ncbi:hypothetical protein [Piscibacillus salipiscarius]|uniref:DUF3918 domain-containing protein n=1 Tax=Piscibacillus salipiscarius TaxID=299480 RepID=A0ABW5Q7F7_9BACI
MNRVISNSAKVGMGAAMGWMIRNNPKMLKKNRYMKRMRKAGKRLKKRYL